MSSFYRILQQEMRGSPYLDLVRRERPYRFPKGYMRYELFSAVVALMLNAMQNVELFAYRNDQASYSNANRTALWFVKDAPIYCLSINLLRAFEQSDIEDRADLLRDFKIAVPTFVVLFPENSLRTPTGAALDYLVVHVSEAGKRSQSEGEAFGIKIPFMQHDFAKDINCCATDSQDVTWLSGFGVLPDGRVHFDHEGSLGTHPLEEGDQAFLQRIRAIVLQILATLSFCPELLDDIPHAIAQKNFSGAKPPRLDTTPARYPRWLGKEYRQDSVKRSHPHSHASPSAHWRRGHWRRVAIGEGRRDRRWHWFEPTYVNPE